VIVSVEVPATVALEVEIVSVEVPELEIEAGEKLAVAPEGKPVADRPTLPAKPFWGVTVIVLAPLLPWVTVTLDGDAERPKSGGAFTVRLTVVA
jgi:hypothetical protein